MVLWNGGKERWNGMMVWVRCRVVIWDGGEGCWYGMLVWKDGME